MTDFEYGKWIAARIDEQDDSDILDCMIFEATRDGGTADFEFTWLRGKGRDSGPAFGVGNYSDTGVIEAQFQSVSFNSYYERTGVELCCQDVWKVLAWAENIILDEEEMVPEGAE